MLPEDLYLCSFPTGSNYICNPPVENTDIDYMFLVYSLEDLDYELKGLGWTVCGKESYNGKPDHWRAYRKDKYNALVTTDISYYNRFEAATELAKKRNLLDKSDRVRLFNDILGEKNHAPDAEF